MSSVIFLVSCNQIITGHACPWFVWIRIMYGFLLLLSINFSNNRSSSRYVFLRFFLPRILWKYWVFPPVLKTQILVLVNFMQPNNYNVFEEENLFKLSLCCLCRFIIETATFARKKPPKKIFFKFNCLVFDF